MKTALRISIWLNLGLLAGLLFVLVDWHRQEAALAPTLSEVKPPAPTATVPTDSASSGMEPEAFHWSQMVSAKDYREYIANLRAIGCPEATIEDIVRGDADRAFSWERGELRLGESGVGPWSRQAEMQLVANLLEGQPAEAAALVQSTKNSTEANRGEVAQTSAPSPNAKAAAPSYPLFLQNANWSDLGFNPGEQAAIAQVRQQFLGEVNSPNQNSGDSTGQNPNSATPANPNANDPASSLPRWQKALQDADNQLRDLLGSQGYAAYEQQQYYSWFQPQLVAANAQGAQLAINPTAFSLK